MAILITILTVALVVAVIFVISAPLRAAWASTTKPVDGPGMPGGRERSGGGKKAQQAEIQRGKAQRGKAQRGEARRGEGVRGEGVRERDRSRGGEAVSRELQRGVQRGEEHLELEAAREAKYREIRDTELDYRTGKLSEEDYAATDGALRKEAVEILNSLAALDEKKLDS